MPLVIGGPYKGGFFGGADVSIEASGTLTDGPIAPLASNYPRLGIFAIGGNGQPNYAFRPGGFPGKWGRAAKHQLVVMNIWRDWTYDGSFGGPAMDATGLADYIKSVSPHANCKVFQYTNPTEVADSTYPGSGTYPRRLFGETAEADELWLYTSLGRTFPGDVAQAVGNNPNYQFNIGPDAPRVSGNNLRFTVFQAKAINALSTDSGSWVLPGFGTRSEYNIDGVFTDVMRYRPRTFGDWDVDGSNNDNDDVDPSQLAKKDGMDEYFTEWRSLEPGFILIGNMTFNYGANKPTPNEMNDAIALGYKDYIDGGIIEAALGRSGSLENAGTVGGWNSVMRGYKRALFMHENVSPNYIFFDNWEKDFDGSRIWDATHTLSEWVRYGLTCAMQDDGYYGCPTTDGFSDCNVINEYEIDMGQPLSTPDYDGGDPTTATSGSGYNSYQNGVYRRIFYNFSTDRYYMVIVNPNGNGTQSITPDVISGYQWNRLDANDYSDPSQDPGVNDGQTNITSQSVEQRKGIFLEGVPT